ncbi:50S ribosomal protein L31, chloroplastic [Phalaenopsis equestris]|uniref:50S ribosomal protein L31, chloroplastic n=1 Tax=Phalaenopsis equestris TaxID=78828 RepID=UPI0009E42ED8|nr:50S ribosomal protein L31, chloroplastic [Phalaenopsis equestris]
MALILSTTFVPSIKASSTKFRNNFKAVVPSGRFRRWSCRKEGVHPEFYENAKVYCNGELVMTTGGTQKEYTVDVWSGNHPFYLGSRSGLVVDDDQVEKFRKKFGQLSELMEIPVLKGEIVLPQKKKAASSKGKGKK